MVKFPDTPQKPKFVPLKPAEVKAVIQAAPHPPIFKEEKAEPKPRKAAIPVEFRADIEDAVDNWLKSYKNHHNDKTERQRKRMKALLEAVK